MSAASLRGARRVACGLRVREALGDNERVLRRFLLKDGVSILSADDQTTHHDASTYRQLRVHGTPIPTNDLWIAALVLQHNLTRHDSDRHFDHLPQDPARLMRASRGIG